MLARLIRESCLIYEAIVIPPRDAKAFLAVFQKANGLLLSTSTKLATFVRGLDADDEQDMNSVLGYVRWRYFSSVEDFLILAGKAAKLTEGAGLASRYLSVSDKYSISTFVSKSMRVYRDDLRDSFYGRLDGLEDARGDLQEYGGDPRVLGLVERLFSLAAEVYQERDQVVSVLNHLIPRAEASSSGELKPSEVETLYHATIVAGKLSKAGFSSSFSTSASGLGGSQTTKSGKQAPSFTADLHVAKEIMRALREVSMIARGELKTPTILDWAKRGGILDKLLDVTAGVEGRAFMQEAESPSKAFAVYRYYLASSKRYDPVFLITGLSVEAYLRNMARVSPSDIGVVAAKVDMTNPDISFYRGMMEYRVPVEAILSVWRAI